MSADRSVTIRLKVASEQYDAAMARAGMEVKALAAEVDNAGRSAGGLAKIEQASNRVADAQAKVAAGSKTLAGLRVQEEAATQKLAAAEDARVNASASGNDIELAKAARVRTAAESELTSVMGKREQAEASLSKASRDLSLAETRLSAVMHDADKQTQKSFSDMLSSAEDAGQKPQAMMLGIAAAAMLVGPAVGAGTAALAGLIGVGGTAYAVFKGFQQEMKDGTPVGLQLQGALAGVGGELTHLEEIAANSASGGVLATIEKLHAAIPGLEPEIASLAAHLGNALNIATPGVIAIAKQLGPILNDTGIDAEHLAQGFTNFANSPQFHQFLDYARRELPVVAGDLKDFATTGVEAAVALQPLGDELLRDADALAKVANFVGRFRGEGDALKTVLLPGAQILDMFGHKTKQVALSQADQAAAALQQSVAQNQANVALSSGYTQAKAFATADEAANHAIDQQAIALAATTRQMYLQSDAGGLLKQQLDRLSGKQLDAAQAQNQFEQGLVNLVKHTTAADAAVSGMSSSAIKNRGDLLSLVQSAESAAEAYGSMDKSGAKTRQRLVDLRKEIIDNAVANGMNRLEVTKFIDSVLKVPARVPPTKLDVDTAAAQLKLAVLNDTLGHMVGPTLTVHAEVAGAMASIRSVVEYAANQSPVIHVTTAFSNGAVFGGRQVGEKVPAHAAGGGVADGWFTAGERGWELGYKSGPNVQFFPHQQSTSMLPGGPSVPAYAAGTGLVTITPSRSKGKAAKSKAGTAAQARLNAVMAVQFKVDNTDLDRLLAATHGTAAQIRSAMGTLIADVHSAAIKGLGSESVIPSLRRGASELESYANRKADVVKRLKAANGQLSAAEKLWADEQKSTAAAVMGTFDAGTAGNGTYGSMVRVLDQKIGQAQRFAADIKSLTGRLNKTALAQIESEGPDQAGANLHALAGASPAQVAAYNAKYGQLQGLAQQVGTNSADSLYKAGVDAAKGLVRGLESQEAAITKAMSKIAASLVAQIKHDLKINSPSKVGFDLGANFGESKAQGVLSAEMSVRAAGTKLAHAAVVSPGQLAYAHAVPHSAGAAQPIDYARLGRSVAEAMQSIPVTGELHGDGAGLSVSVSKRSSRRVQ